MGPLAFRTAGWALVAVACTVSGSACSSSGKNTTDAGNTSPIALADAWVEGWYGTPFHGVNRYEQLNEAGYPNGYYTLWRGDPGVTLFANVTDCSGFSNVLMTRAFGWLPSAIHDRPEAEDYYWAIRTGDHFAAVENVSEVDVGDVIALLYSSPDAAGNTGHVAWVDVLPEPYSGGPIRDPGEPNLTQLAVAVIDSSSDFHYAPPGSTFPQDDRYLGPIAGGGQCATDGECIARYGQGAVCETELSMGPECAFTGIGRGRMRLYVDASGSVAGYTWGTSEDSTFYARPDPVPQRGAAFSGRDIVIGRYTAQ